MLLTEPMDMGISIQNEHQTDPSALTKAGGAIGHMYDRAVIHMTDRDVRA